MKAIYAQYESECEYCGERIDEGDHIAKLDDEWVHAQCAEAEGVEVEYD